MSGLPWHVALIKRLLEKFPTRIVGLKDSSGDMGYARAAAAIASDFAVFPSTEAALIEARDGAFAGCISATANCNADLCARAWNEGDAAALEAAVAIRKLFDGKPLVSGVKALLAHIHGDPALARVKPPLAAFSAADRAAVIAGHDAVRAKRVARDGFSGVDARAWPYYKPRPWRRACSPPPLFVKIGRCSGIFRRKRSLPTRESWPIPVPPAKPRARSRARPKSTKRAARCCAARSARLEEAIASGDRTAALAAFKEAEPVIMRAAQRGVVHKNNASRKVSRLSKRIAKLAQVSKPMTPHGPACRAGKLGLISFELPLNGRFIVPIDAE